LGCCVVSDHIDENHLKGNGIICGVEEVEDREGMRPHRFDIRMDHVQVIA